MIAGDRWEALFKTSHGLWSTPVVALDVIDGELVVFVEMDGAPRRADRYDNFEGLRESDGPVVAALPGAGWEYRHAPDGEWDAVAWWHIYASGAIRAVDVAGDGPDEVFGASIEYRPHEGWPAQPEEA